MGIFVAFLVILDILGLIKVPLGDDFFLGIFSKS